MILNFEEVLDAIPDAVILVDSRGLIVYINAQTEQLFHTTRGDLFGKPIELLMPERFRQKHPEYRGFYARERNPRPMGTGKQLFARRLDGTEFPADISLSPLKTPEGILVITTVRDVTDRVRLDEQYRQSQKVEALGRLAGGVAHDFNNLLTVISGYSEVALKGLHEKDPLYEELGEVVEAARRAAQLTGQLLAFGRKQIISPMVIDLNPIISKMEKMLRRLIGEDVEFVTYLQPDLNRIKVDPSQIEQVIVNLAVNARDAMPKGGKLTIESHNITLDESYAKAHVSVNPGEYVMLSVSDTGIGMDEETRSYLFEPFFTTKGPGKGTGLGLATVYGIVKQSGGHIWVYSETGRGAIFKVYFPQVTEQADRVRLDTPLSRTIGGSETVLIAEDEEALRKLGSLILRRNGYTVLEGANGDEALLLSEQHAGGIHLLITDVVMPQMSGQELARLLGPKRPDMKVLYVSGYTANAIVHHGVLDQGVNFLPKPFTADAILRKVRDVLDSPSRADTV